MEMWRQMENTMQKAELIMEKNRLTRRIYALIIINQMSNGFG